MQWTNPRDIVLFATGGAVAGVLMSLPAAFGHLSVGPDTPAERGREMAFAIAAIVPAPGLAFRMGSRVLVLLVNALLWAVSFLVVGSRSHRGAARVAKLVTLGAWGLWSLLVVAGVQAMID